jgi:Ca2+-transporting ATPase
VAVAIGVVGLAAGRELELMIETAIALAIAAVPEGLPIVATLALARGMWRMLKRNALMRRLSSVETLGATNIICTDKTGTLSKGQMTVERLNLVSDQIDVQLNGQQIFSSSDGQVEPADDAMLETALKIGLMCNDAELPAEDETAANGDPLEVALLEVGHRAGLSRVELLEQMPEMDRHAFDRETKQMATVHESQVGYFVAVKGAPASVLKNCRQLYTGNGGDPLDEQGRQDWLQRNRQMAEDGLRVLALATKIIDNPAGDIYEDLQFVGLIGLIDPPRPGIQEAIGRCQQAGVRAIMATGDQPETGRAIARSVGLVADENAPVVHGAELDDNKFEEHRNELLQTDIFARVTPAQKLNLIDLHQENGAIVGMTGDGVNDAPALKSADIGIAMGQRGTQVAQEAADMILQDDAFPTIVAAIEQGRVIFENIRKFVIYLLSGNVGIILAVALATFFGKPLPLLPLQILYLNMINDAFPALALGVGEDSRAVMGRPPRDAGESIIARYHWGEIVGYGLLIGLNLLLTFYLAFTWLKLDESGAVTVSFLTLSISRLLHAFNMRSAASGLLDNEIVRNPYMWGAIGLSISLLLAAVYWSPLANVLQLSGLDVNGWLLVLGASVVPLIIGQIYVMGFKANLLEKAGVQ